MMTTLDGGRVATAEGAQTRDTFSRATGERVGRASSMRVSLLLGFTAVFALWLVWGYQLVQNLGRIEHNVESLQRSYVLGEQALTRVRTNVLLSSIYLRDALIDNVPSRRDSYRDELRGLQEETDKLIAVYLPDVPRPEQDRWIGLQEELRDYWTTKDVALKDSAQTPIQAYLLLRQQVVPRRDGVLQIVDQLGMLQNAAREKQQTETAALYAAVRARLILIGSLTLVAAFVVAVLATRHVSHLHRQVEQQQLAERRIRHDLERLSARLVDVQENERRQLSRELHDAIGQALTAVKMDIGIALRGEVSSRTRAALDEANDITESTLQNIRDLSQLLHPSTLDDFGLPDTLRTYLKRFSDRTGIRAQLTTALPERLPPDIEASVYRITQEAMNNVARHSGASVCSVNINTNGRKLRLTVEDNGRGLTAGRGHGLGLVAMRERAQAQGGSFAIEAPSSGGTRVVVTMDVEPRDAVVAQRAQAG